MTWAAACFKQAGVSLSQLLLLQAVPPSCVNSFRRLPETGAGEAVPETPLWLAGSCPTNSHTVSSLSSHCIPVISDGDGRGKSR